VPPAAFVTKADRRRPNGLRLSGARKGVRCSRGLGDLMLVELQADTRGNDHVKLPPAPRLHFERANLRGNLTILLIQRIQVGHSDAEAGVVGPRLIVVLDKVEFDAIPPDPRHSGTLPNDSEAHVVPVKGDGFSQAAAGWNQRRD